MSRYELLLFVHIATAAIWVGGATIMQFFGLRAMRAPDPMRLVDLGGDIEWIGSRVLIPASALAVVWRLAGDRQRRLGLRRRLDRPRDRSLRDHVSRRRAVLRARIGAPRKAGRGRGADVAGRAREAAAPARADAGRSDAAHPDHLRHGGEALVG